MHIKQPPQPCPVCSWFICFVGWIVGNCVCCWLCFNPHISSLLLPCSRRPVRVGRWNWPPLGRFDYFIGSMTEVEELSPLVELLRAWVLTREAFARGLCKKRPNLNKKPTSLAQRFVTISCNSHVMVNHSLRIGYGIPSTFIPLFLSNIMGFFILKEDPSRELSLGTHVPRHAASSCRLAYLMIRSHVRRLVSSSL